MCIYIGLSSSSQCDVSGVEGALVRMRSSIRIVSSQWSIGKRLGACKNGEDEGAHVIRPQKMVHRTGTPMSELRVIRNVRVGVHYCV